MPPLDESFPGMHDALVERYGRPAPPAEGREPFEAVVATLLDRVLDPRKRAAALTALRDEGLLDPQALAEADPAEVDEALRAAGVAVRRGGLAPLRRLARWVVDLHHGSAEELADPDGPASTTRLREELLALNGVGPATADAILLFALRRPVYPLDRATYRVLIRHGWLDPETDYDEARGVVERLAPDDAAELSVLSAWFERLGKDHCRASVARCDRCPLQPFLPDGGPIEPGGF